MSFDDDLNACAAIVEKGDPARFRTVMAAPVAARAKLFPLYAFNVEVARAPWVTAEPMIAEMRLQWWRDALEEIRAGGLVRRHEVVTPLAQVLRAEDVPLLDSLVAARRWDCYGDAFEDEAHLFAYLTETSGHLMQVAAAALGAPDAPGLAAGQGFGALNLLRAAPALEAQGRVPLVDGSHAGICKLANWGLQNLQTARTGFAKTANPAFWPASGAARALRLIRRQPERVAQGRAPQTPGRLFAVTVALGRW